MPRAADPALPQRRRAQIIEAARGCFRERGLRETTIEEICAEARMSPGALYRYFDSKADIIAAIVLDARAEAEAMLDRLADAEGLIDGLGEMAQCLFAAFDNDVALLDVYAEAARDHELARALHLRDCVVVGRLASAIEAAVRTGRAYPAMSAVDAAEMLLAALEGMALRRTLRPDGDAEAVRRFRSLALHILKPKR